MTVAFAYLETALDLGWTWRHTPALECWVGDEWELTGGLSLFNTLAFFSTYGIMQCYI